MKSLHRFAFLIAAIIALLTWNQVARATSTITINMPIARSNSSHPNNNGTANQISRADCLNDDVMTFPLSVTYDLSLNFQVWVGNAAACTDDDARTGTAPKCGMVYATANVGSINPSIGIRVQDILRALNHPAAVPTNYQGQGTPADCDASTQTNPVPQELDFFFMFLNGTTVDSSAEYQTKFSLLGPAAPTGITVGPGDTLLKVSWDTAAVGTVAGYYFFCSPNRGHEPIGGGRVVEAGSSSSGAGGAGGAGGSGGNGGSAGDSTCDASTDATDDTSDGGAELTCLPSTSGSGGSDDGGDSGESDDTGDAAGSTGCDSDGVLVGGSIPSDDLFTNNRCGSSDGATANSGLITGLQDGISYAVSVASYDTLGNTGVLSVPLCGIPVQIDDFVSVYRSAGGTAGGSSFCSVSAPGRSAGGGAASAVLVGLALAGYRARRSSGRGRGSRRPRGQNEQ
jgi:hypothetical protein